MLYIALDLDGYMSGHHVTLSFNPIIEYLEKCMNMLGKRFTLKITHDGVLRENGEVMNTGYRVELPEELKPMFTGRVAHITTYVNPKSKAVRTAECTWTKHYEALGPTMVSGTVQAFDSFNRIECYTNINSVFNTEDDL